MLKTNAHKEGKASVAGLEVVTVTLNPALDQQVTISNFETGRVNRVETSIAVAGGKGVNVACVLADAGHKVAATGFLGFDNVGPFEALCRSKNVEELFLCIAGSTRTGIKITDPVNGSTTDINFPGLALDAGDVGGLWDLLGSLQSQWVVLAGSVPPGLDLAVYRDLVYRLKQRGHKVAVDTSGMALLRVLEAGPHLIKPNIYELQQLVGHSLDGPVAVAEAARDLLSADLKLVVVSMGAEGACFVTQEETVLALPPEVPVLSSVGAGDAMLAGTISGLLRKLPLGKVAALATAFGVEALGRLEAGLGDADAVAALAQRVRITTIP